MHQSKPCADHESILKHEKANGVDINPEVAEATVEVLASDLQESDAAMLQKVHPVNGRVTLHLALERRDTFQSAVPDLWRLLCHLRIGEKGADSRVVPNHFLTRGRCSKKIQKWQNVVRHEQCLVNAANDKGAIKKRSRDSAWVDHCEKVRVEHCSGLPSSLVIEDGHLVAALVDGAWRCSLVLSCWRHYRKGNKTSQLTAQEISRGGLHSARVCIMEQPDPKMPSLFQANSSSACTVLTSTQIGLRLDTPKTDMKRGSDGMKVVLPEDRFGLMGSAFTVLGDILWAHLEPWL